MPHPEDTRLLQHAVGRGLLTDPEAQHVLWEIQTAEQQGKTLRATQVLMRQRLMETNMMVGLLKEIRDLSSSNSGQDLIGSETWGEVTAADQATPPVNVGYRLGEYELRREVARGGMGVLFEAWAGPNKMAIKVLSREAAESPQVLMRFQEEARLAAILEHPNLIRVYQLGFLEPDIHYIVMDFFEGRTLADLIRPGRLAPKKAISVMGTIARACSYMHGQGVIHRDIKPSNIMVGKGGAVCLADFGLAKDTARFDAKLTQMGFGKLLGTPAYMAPEQARGELSQVGPCTDVYAIGAVVFRSLTGRYPFASNSYMKTIQSIAMGPIPRLSALRPDTPPALDELIYQAMALDPSQRPDAATLAGGLEQLESQILMPPAPPGEAV